MSLDRPHSQCDQVVVIDGSRGADALGWRELADIVTLTCAGRRPTAVLLDVRNDPFTPTSREADVLASALAGTPLVAIVAGPDASYGCARMIATSIELRGRSAAAFRDEVQA